MSPLVSPSWLYQRIEDTNVVVLDATLPPVGVKPPIDTHATYLTTHIPGALFFDIEKMSDKTTSLPHMLPTEKEFSRLMSSLGVGDDMQIVVYEQAGVFSAPRAWWMLRTFGATNVFILDGGLRAWSEAKFPLQSGPPHRAPHPFKAHLDSNAVKTFAQIQELISSGGQILDARTAARFNGVAPEPRPGLSSGHMPGAMNLPFGELVEAGRLKSGDKIREIFSDKGVNLDEPIVTTCGSGVTAAVLVLGLYIAGAKQVGLFDGSWAEYAQRPEAKIEKS